MRTKEYYMVIDYITDQLQLYVSHLDFDFTQYDVVKLNIRYDDLKINMNLNYDDIEIKQFIKELLEPLSYKLIYLSVERIVNRDNRVAITATINPTIGYLNDDYFKKVFLAKYGKREEDV